MAPPLDLLRAAPGNHRALAGFGAQRGLLRDRVLMDELYLKRMSAGFDLSILLRTSLVVVKPTGK